MCGWRWSGSRSGTEYANAITAGASLLLMMKLNPKICCAHQEVLGFGVNNHYHYHYSEDSTHILRLRYPGVAETLVDESQWN